MRSALVCGAGGFIGNHLVERLKRDGFWVRGVDLQHPEYCETRADDFILADLRDRQSCRDLIDRPFDEIYQLAADMGGAGYIFTGEHDAEIMHNSALINLNVVDVASRRNCRRIFYSSSACMYPAHNQEKSSAPVTSESSAYPANPDSEYGWEKLFSERLYFAYGRDLGIEPRVARFHNIFGPLGTWQGGKEKAPAAICRKVAEAPDGGVIDIWGDGQQTRSFLYIDECVEGILRLMRSGYSGPVNIGSDEMVTVDELVALVARIAGKSVQVRHIPGPQGVRGRTSDNTLIRQVLGWAPRAPLAHGMATTYAWIEERVAAQKAAEKPIAERVRVLLPRAEETEAVFRARREPAYADASL